VMPIVLLSPAKTLDEKPLHPSIPRTAPRMAQATSALVAIAKKLTAPKIQTLMGVSAAIAK